MKKIILWFTGAALVTIIAGTGFILVRQARAAGEAERKWQSTRVAALEDIGSTSRLEILPLYEEARDPDRYQIGHGLSYLVRTDSLTLLLDTGNNPEGADPAPLAANMRALGVSWDQIDAVMISHFHPDHVGGVSAWKAGEVSLGTAVPDLKAKPIYAPSPFDLPGTAPTLLPEPTVLAPGIATLGTIPYGETYPMSLYKALGAEQTLAINVEGEGIVLIMGCGHPTVERIVARAEAVFERPVVGIVGGFHYEGLSTTALQPHLEFLRTLDLQLLAPSPHDSDPNVLSVFQSSFPEIYQNVQVGTAISFPAER